MFKLGAKGFWTRYLLLLWIVLTIAVFIYYPGRANLVYGAALNSWQPLLSGLSRIDPLGFASSILWALVGVLIYTAVCVSVGRLPLLGLRNVPDAHSPSRLGQFALLATAFAVGQALLSMVLLAFAIFGLLTPWLVVSFMAIGLGVGGLPIARSLNKDRITRLLNPFDASDSTFDRTVIWLNVAALAFTLLYSSARLSYDSVALYFSAAKITAMTDHIQFFSNDSFIVSFFQTGIHYAALIQIFGDQAARMYSWVSALAILIFAAAIGEREGLSKRAILLLCTLVLTSTAFIDLMGDGKIELASTVPVMGAIYWMEMGSRRLPRSLLLLTGALAGLAITARPYNFLLMPLVMAAATFQRGYLEKKENGHWLYMRFVQPMLWICLGIFGPLTYHLIANASILGDPLAFAENSQKLTSGIWQWALDPRELWLFRLFYPFVVTFLNTSQSLGNITPLFLAFVPVLLAKEIRVGFAVSRDLVILMSAVLVTLVLWITLFFTVFEIRYVLFAWIILFMPAAVLMEKMTDNPDSFLRLTTKSILIAVLALATIRTAVVSIETYSPIDRQGEPHCFQFQFCDFLEPINALASSGDRVLTLNAYRYYLRPDLFACSTTHEEYFALQSLSHDSSAFWTEAYREGYRFVAYEANYSVRHLYLDLVPDPDFTPPWLTLKTIYGRPGDPEVAYEIQASGPPIRPDKTCSQTSSGIWTVQSASQPGN